MFSIIGKFIFGTKDATVGVARFRAQMKQTSEEMKILKSSANSSNVSVTQMLQLMKEKRAPSEFQRNMALASTSMRSVTNAIKEGRLLYRDIFGKQKTVRVNTRSAVKQVKQLTGAVKETQSSFLAASSVMMLGLQSLGGGSNIFGGNIVKESLTLAGNAENARVTFDSLLGSAAESEKLLGRITDYSAKTPFTRSDIVEGSKRLLTITGKNIDENERLFKLASQIAALKPGSSVEGVAEAMVSGAVGEFDSLKSSYGLILRADMFKNAGQAGGKEYTAAVMAEIEKQLQAKTGGRDLVAALGETMFGRISTLQDVVEMSMEAAGSAMLNKLDIKDMLGAITPLIDQFGSALRAVTTGVGLEKLDGMEPIIVNMANYVNDAINALVWLKDTAISIGKPIINMFRNMGSTAQSVFFGSAAAFVGMSTVLGIVAPAIATVVTTIATLAMFLAPLAEFTVPTLITGLSVVAGILAPIAIGVAAGTVAFMLFRKKGEGITETFGRIGKMIKSLIAIGFQILKSFFTPIIERVGPALSVAFQKISFALEVLKRPLNEFFSLFAAGGVIFAFEQFATIGAKVGDILATAIGAGAEIAFTVLTKLAGLLEYMRPWFKHVVSDIMRMARAFVALITGTGSAVASLKVIMTGMFDMITIPFRAILVELMKMIADTMDGFAAQIQPFSSLLASKIGEGADKARKSAETIREGFLATTERFNSEMNVNMASTITTPVQLNIDGEKVADTLAKTEVRARNSGRGGDPVTPEEMGFVMEGGTRIRTVDMAEVAGRS
jgi:hypothetical protein